MGCYHENAQRLTFSNFDGGINLAAPPEGIADNELAEATNCEYDLETGVLRTACGIDPVQDCTTVTYTP